MVGHSPQSLNAEDLIQYLNNAAGKTSTSVTQEPGQGSKDRDKASIQKFSNGFCSLIGVTYASTYLVKWSWKTKMLATQGDLSNSMVVSILVKSTCKRSSGAVATIWHKGAFGVLPSYWRQCL